MTLPAIDDALERYRTALADTPRPTTEQIQAFAEHVATAHSWYKHLPWWPPGAPFIVYLDPAAGMALSPGAGGDVIASSRQEHGPHYSDLPTEDYRRRFGFLNFATRLGAKVAPAAASSQAESLAPPGDDGLYFEGRTRALVPLPNTVASVGATRVSGVIHPLGRNASAVLRAFPSVRASQAQGARFVKTDVGATLSRARELVQSADRYVWPAASGGQAQLAKILARVTQLVQDPGSREPAPLSPERAEPWDPEADRVLLDLIEPERRHQVNELAAACRRVCALVAE